jgi:hypothetical protein
MSKAAMAEQAACRSVVRHMCPKAVRMAVMVVEEATWYSKLIHVSRRFCPFVISITSAQSGAPTVKEHVGMVKMAKI